LTPVDGSLLKAGRNLVIGLSREKRVTSILLTSRVYEET